jgi:6,7-dimethyl-8-ribityllumazine synthase
MSDSFPNNKIKSGSPLNLNITIVYSEFNSDIVNNLLDTTEKRLIEISKPILYKICVPGAYEIPFAVKKIINLDNLDAIICLGAIIRGETTHYELISENVFRSISDINEMGIIPVINEDQAKKRILNGNYFAESCISMIKLNKDLA